MFKIWCPCETTPTTIDGTGMGGSHNTMLRCKPALSVRYSEWTDGLDILHSVRQEYTCALVNVNVHCSFAELYFFPVLLICSITPAETWRSTANGTTDKHKIVEECAAAEDTHWWQYHFEWNTRIWMPYNVLSATFPISTARVCFSAPRAEEKRNDRWVSDYNREIATKAIFEVLPVLFGGDEPWVTGIHHRHQCQHIDLANDLCTLLKFIREILGNSNCALLQHDVIIESPDRCVQEQWYVASFILEAVLGDWTRFMCDMHARRWRATWNGSSILCLRPLACLHEYIIERERCSSLRTNEIIRTFVGLPSK